jgi:hypothetical protein
LQNFQILFFFSGTIAQEYDRFWVGLQSDPVQVLPKGQVPPSIGISTQRPPLFSSTSNYQPAAQAQTPTPLDPIYSGCGDTKSCFGFPNNCITTHDCKAVSTIHVRGDKYVFSIKSGPGEYHFVVTLKINFPIFRCRTPKASIATPLHKHKIDLSNP